MTIGSKIRTLRSLKNLTQENMSGLLDISSNAYGKIERGKTDISYSRLEQIASIFEKSVVELLDFGENQQSSNAENSVKSDDTFTKFNNVISKVNKLALEVSRLRGMVEVVKK